MLSHSSGFASSFLVNIHSYHQIKNMSCTKDFFRLSVILFGLTFIKAQDVVSSASSVNDGLKGNCSCGGFPTSTPDINSEPLLSQSPGLMVNCDDEGATTCKNLCLALATATKAKGPEILCARLKDAKELKLSAFYKLCSKPWSYADMTADEPLCCEDSKVKVCPSTESPGANANAAVV